VSEKERVAKGQAFGIELTTSRWEYNSREGQDPSPKLVLLIAKPANTGGSRDSQLAN